MPVERVSISNRNLPTGAELSASSSPIGADERMRVADLAISMYRDRSDVASYAPSTPMD